MFFFTLLLLRVMIMNYLSNFNFIKTKELKTQNLKGWNVNSKENYIISKSHILLDKMSSKFLLS